MKPVRQAVILAAGGSTRTHPLTVTRPKPLLPLFHQTLIEHNLDQLVGLVDEALIVVGYLKEQIQDKVGENYRGLKVRYVDQSEPKGTADALGRVEPFLSGRFLVMNGDDLYHRADIQRCLTQEIGMLAARHEDVSRFGVLQVEGDQVVDIIEKPETGAPGLVNTGMYVLDRRVFEQKTELSIRGEFELVDYIRMLDSVSFVEVEHSWMPVTYPWHLIEANAHALQSMSPQILGKVEDNVHLRGDVHIGRGTTVRAGTYIEGPVYIGSNCTIGPGAYLRPDTVILDDCFIGHGVEIVDSVVMAGTFCKHRAYIGHSVIGAGCNIGAGLITADFRHDAADVQTLVKGEKINSHRQKLGAFLGDNIYTGVHTTIYPGRKLWPEQTTLPGEVVDKDKS